MSFKSLIVCFSNKRGNYQHYRLKEAILLVPNNVGCASRGLYAVRRLLMSRLLCRQTKLRIWNAVLRPMLIYGCETWSLTARNRGRLLVFKNHVLRTILGPKWDPLTRQLRIRSNHEIRNLTQQPLITSVLRSRRLRWAGHVVKAPEERGIHKALCGRAAGRRPQGSPRGRQPSLRRYFTGDQGLAGCGLG